MAKKKTVAVAISPDRGLEVAEMDYTTGTIAKKRRKHRRTYPEAV